MIQMAFWHNERVVTGTLAGIAGLVEKAGIQPPATLVVGDVVRLREKLQASQRDLRRRPDDSTRFDPAPAPDQLLRLAAAGIGSQLLRLALAVGVFDQLEDFRQVPELSGFLDLRPEALGEMLTGLVALGLVEARPEGYRNLELASRYLRSESPQSLKPAVLHLAGRSDCWQDLARYVFSGHAAATEEEEGGVSEEACESLARFAAPAVAEKLDLGGRSTVLLLGWGGAAYREALGRCWPEVALREINPFKGGVLPNGGPYKAVLLSGILACARRGQVEQLLAAAAACLAPGGLLALHDSFLPVGTPPPMEVMLESLARRMTRDGCRDWPVDRLRTSLHALGLADVRAHPLPAGTLLVTASKV
jgi:hypothetical protein